MYGNECNNKVILFSDGEENSSEFYPWEPITLKYRPTSKKLAEKLTKLIGTQGWNYFLAYTYRPLDDDSHTRFYHTLRALVNNSEDHIFHIAKPLENAGLSKNDIQKKRQMMLSWLYKQTPKECEEYPMEGCESSPFTAIESVFDTDLWTLGDRNVDALREVDI